MVLDLTHLRSLAAVIDGGSFSAGARHLHLSQPAVSRQIALLERQLQVQLLVRGAGGVRPTPAGRLLLDHATAVLDRLTLAETQVRALSDARRGMVRLGSFFSALVRLSAELAVAIDQEHLDLRITDDLVDRDTAYAKLGRGELDLAIVFEHDFARTPIPESLQVMPLFDDPVRILLPGHHQLAQQPAVDPADLADDTWIRAHDGSAADLTERLLTTRQIDPPRLMVGHGDEPVEAQALVAAGRGVTLTHDLTVIISHDNIVMKPLTAYAGVRHIGVAYTTGHTTAAAKATLNTLGRIGDQHQARLRRTR